MATDLWLIFHSHMFEYLATWRNNFSCEVLIHTSLNRGNLLKFFALEIVSLATVQSNWMQTRIRGVRKVAGVEDILSRFLCIYRTYTFKSMRQIEGSLYIESMVRSLGK